MTRVRALIGLVVLATGVAAVGATGSAVATQTARPVASDHRHACCPLPVFGPGATYRPVIHPDRFGPDVTNPWFPLRPGTVYVYAGTKDGQRAIDVFAVSGKTRI